jgi:hypothetical protein
MIVTQSAFNREIERVLVTETKAGFPLGGPLTMVEPGSTLTRRFRHNAPLVTQLMAVRMDEPQTRARRRAAPAEGVAAYGATGTAITLGLRARGPSWPA